MQVPIKQKHIYEGQGGCSFSCAVALAVKDKFKTNDVRVSITHEDNVNEKYQISFEVKDKKFITNDTNVYYFICDFDMGGAVKPMQFNIEEAKQ